MRVHVWPSPHWVDDDTYATIVAVATDAEAAIRAQLPTLERDLYLLVNPTELVIPETGDGGYTIGPHCIRWDVDPSRGIAAIASAHLRSTLFHECHHAVRLQRRPEDARVIDWPSVAVFEGLATAFEDAARDGDDRPPWAAYDADVVRDWADELFRQPVDERWMQWKFDHPDGRRNIAYRVGTWIADEAIARSGRSAAELVWEAPAAVLALAGLRATD